MQNTLCKTLFHLLFISIDYDPDSYNSTDHVLITVGDNEHIDAQQRGQLHVAAKPFFMACPFDELDKDWDWQQWDRICAKPDKPNCYRF